MSAVGTPGTRTMYARQRSAATDATSIRYARPPIDSSKRWTIPATVLWGKCCLEKGGFYALSASKQAKRVTKTRAQAAFAGFLQLSGAKYIFVLARSTGNAPFVNSFCTAMRRQWILTVISGHTTL